MTIYGSDFNSGEFLTKYLVWFSKIAIVSSKVSVGIKTNCPLLWQYSFDDKALVRFFLAPQVKG